MKAVFINNSEETFTPARSGAICTVLHEVALRTMVTGNSPVVITRGAAVPPYQDVPVLLFRPPRLPKNALSVLAMRAQRKILQYRNFRHGAYIRRVAAIIRQHTLNRDPMIVSNDPDLAVRLMCLFPGATVIHWFHNQLECKNRFRSRVRGLGIRCIAVSDFTARWVENYYGLPANSVSTVYNGVDAQHFSPASAPPPGPPVINFLGRTGFEKGPDILLEAALLLAQKGLKFKLQLIGSNHWDRFELDDYQRKLAALVEKLEKLGISVRRPGHIGRAALPDELRQAHIHVFTSRWDEPFGMATLEGMACGLATVASNTGGTPEVVGDAGLLFERENVTQLAGHLTALILDDGLHRQWAAKARRRAEQFTWGGAWDRIRAVLDGR